MKSKYHNIDHCSPGSICILYIFTSLHQLLPLHAPNLQCWIILPHSVTELQREDLTITLWAVRVRWPKVVCLHFESHRRSH